MVGHNHEVKQGRSLAWGGAARAADAAVLPALNYTYLLDEDDDLAGALDPAMIGVARRGTTVRVLRAEVGEHDLGRWFDAAAEGPGLLVLEGVLVFETHVGGRIAAELIGAGALLMAPRPRAEELVEQGVVWRVLAPLRVGLLDRGFLERARAWPQLTRALMRRVSQRVCDVDALRAIASHPRLEVRLVLLLWHLASRWGRVEPAGIRLSLPLTHRLLGQLVGAERPSVTHALRRLDTLGLISGSAGDLHLHGSMDVHLATLTQRSATRHTPPSTAVPAVHQAM